MMTKRTFIVMTSLLAFTLTVGAHTLPTQEVKKTCRVHGSLLENGEAPIIYGMPVEDKVYERARAKRFPNANSHIEGGCEASAPSPKTQGVFYCSQCRSAEDKWMKTKRKRG